MTYTKAVTIWCDGVLTDGLACNEWHDGQGMGTIGATETVAGARASGKQYGWAYRGGRDLCPDCAADQEFRTQEEAE